MTQLADYINYNPQTGEFTWARASGKKRPGDPAGTRNLKGYCQIQVAGTLYLAHRLAWFLTHGVWPTQIDHINRDKMDNRLCNLRECSTAENQNNIPAQKNNATGVRYVTYDKRRDRYVVRITVRGAYAYCEQFRTLEEAAKAARVASQRIHGEFSCQ